MYVCRPAPSRAVHTRQDKLMAQKSLVSMLRQSYDRALSPHTQSPHSVPTCRKAMERGRGAAEGEVLSAPQSSQELTGTVTADDNTQVMQWVGCQ